MISVVIDVREGEEERLARTLASLVPATVEGAVREAVVIGAGEAVKVADHAGCRVAGSLAEAVETTRCDWLLFLEPGARLLGGWSEAALSHMSGKAGPARFSRERSAKVTLAQRLRPRLLSRGLLIAREEARRLLKGGVGKLPGRLRLGRLAARIVPAA